MISIIIPFRNEATHLESLLGDLLRQDELPSEVEIILVDDHSTDKGPEIIMKMADLFSKASLVLIGPYPHVTSKKTALKAGVDLASGDILLFTDADTRIPSLWASQMAKKLLPSGEHKLIFGPVGLLDSGNFNGIIQVMESAAFLTVGRCSSAMGIPLLASGASLGIRKDTLQALGDDPWNMAYPSGDDIFLMSNVQKTFGIGSITFLDNPDITVFTDAVKTWDAFVWQRARWISKNLAVPSFSYIFAFILVALSNLVPVILSVLTLFFPKPFIVPFLISWGIKLLLDGLLIYPGLKFFKRQELFFRYFLPAALVYPFLAVITALVKVIARNRWKGRLTDKSQFKN